MFSSGDDAVLVDAICNDLLITIGDIYAEDEFDSTGKLVYHSPHWMSFG